MERKKPGTATEESLQNDKVVRDAHVLMRKLKAMTPQEKEEWYKENATSFDDLLKQYNLTENDL